MLWIPHQLVGAPLGYSVTLECFTEAHPSSLNYWTREDGHMIHDNKKYRAETSVGSPTYKSHMRLTISNVQEKDFGTYKCVAKNPRGETDGTIRLYSKYRFLELGNKRNIIALYLCWGEEKKKFMISVSGEEKLKFNELFNVISNHHASNVDKLLSLVFSFWVIFLRGFVTAVYFISGKLWGLLGNFL